MTNSNKLGVRDILEWLIPAYVFLLPWQARYIIAEFSANVPRYGGLGVYATDAVFFIAVVCWFFYLRSERKKPHPEWKRLRLPLVATLVFFAYATISLLWTTDQTIGREFLFRLSQAALVAMMIASGAVGQKRLLQALAFTGALQGAIAVAQFFMQSIPASTILGMSAQSPNDLGVSVIEYGDQRWLRAYGTLPHPNVLGAVCAIGMLAAMTLFWRAYQHSERKLALTGWVTFIFSYFGLLFSFSRTSWLAIGVAGVVYLFIELVVLTSETRRQFVILFLKLFAVAVFFLFFFSAIFNPLWWTRYLGQGRLAQQSVTDRQLLAQEAKELAKGQYWFGSGVGSYLPQLVLKNPTRPSYEYQPAHEIWRVLLVEYGIIGLVLVAAVFITLLIQAIRSQLWLLLPTLSLFGVAAFLDHYWYSLPVGMLLAAVLMSVPFAKTSES